VICRNRPIRVLNLSANDSFGSGATKTIIIPVSGMSRFSLWAFFTTNPGTAPTISLSEDGVNWDDMVSVTLAPGSTSLYKAEIEFHSASFLKLVLTAGPGASDSARVNAHVWPYGDGNED